MEERSGPPFLEEKGLLQVLHRRKEEGPKHPFLRGEYIFMYMYLYFNRGGLKKGGTESSFISIQ